MHIHIYIYIYRERERERERGARIELGSIDIPCAPLKAAAEAGNAAGA